MDSVQEKLFQMRLSDIYERHPWLEEEISQEDFTALFPVEYKNNRALTPNRPVEFELGRDIFLEVLIAFRQSFN